MTAPGPDGAAASPWATLDSRVLVEDRWIRLRADRIRTAAGAEIAPWYVLDYPDWAVAVALTDDDRLVLIRQWRHAAQAWSLELPGGVVDAADADPMEAARRELLEETGYDAAAWRYLFGNHANPSTQTNRLHVALAIGARQVAAPRPEPGETIRVETVPVDQAVATLLEGGLGQMMHVGAILAALAAAGRIALPVRR